MVIGLESFKAWFSGYENQYVEKTGTYSIYCISDGFEILHVKFWGQSGLEGVRTLAALIYAESGISLSSRFGRGWSQGCITR